MNRLLIHMAFLLLPLGIEASEYKLQFFDDLSGLSHWHTSRTVQDSTGMMWIATWNGLNRFDGSRFVTFKTNAGDKILTPSDKIRRIELDEENNLICVVEDSLYLFNTHTCRFDTLTRPRKEQMQEHLHVKHNPDLLVPKEIYTQLGNLTLRNIRYDYIDNADNHWLVDDHGLYIATPVIPRGRRINEEEARYLCRMDNGEIWAAVRYTNKVSVYDSLMRWRRTDTYTAPVYCIRPLDDGSVWMGTKPGPLIRIKDGKRQEYPTVRNVYDILPDKAGRLWLATYGFGVWREKDGDFVQVPGTENLFVRRLMLVDDTTLLAATTTGLLCLRDTSIAIYQREAYDPNSLSSNAVMCMMQHDGVVYIGTEGGGLNLIRTGDIKAGKWQFSHLNMTQGLPSDIVFEITEWNDTTLLLQGNSAFTLLDTRELAMVSFGSTYFNYSDGQRLLLGEVPPLWLPDGHLLVAPNDGVLLLDRTDLQLDTVPVRIAISAIQRSTGPVDYAADTVSRIVLAPHERSIGIWYSALDYRNTGAILYKSRMYRRGAVLPEWSAATASAEIQIPDLHPGEYIFEICSTNAYRQWQNNCRKLVIVVEPTFMESTFGKILMLLFVLAALLVVTVSLLHARTLKQKRQEALEAYLDIQERLAVLAQSHTRQTEPLPEVMVAGYLNKNEQFIQTLTSFMESNMGNTDVTVDDLMAATAMSRTSLNRKMHELFNLSPKDFLQEARIKHACSLLKQTDLSVKEIAYSCGFSNPHYFATCFKSSVGITPTEFREK